MCSCRSGKGRVSISCQSLFAVTWVKTDHYTEAAELRCFTLYSHGAKRSLFTSADVFSLLIILMESLQIIHIIGITIHFIYNPKAISVKEDNVTFPYKSPPYIAKTFKVDTNIITHFAKKL